MDAYNTSVSGSIIGFDIGLGYRVRTLPLGRDRWGRYSTEGGYILSSLRFLSTGNGGTEEGVKTIEERLGKKGGAFLNGKEGRVGFRKTPFLTLKKDGMILEKMAGEVPGAYFIKLLFGSWHGACLLIDIER